MAPYLSVKNSKKTSKLSSKYSHLQYPKKRAKRGTLSNFLTSILLQNIKKIDRGPVEDYKNFWQKVSQFGEKKIKGGRL